MHEALIDADNDGAENITVKYVQECRVMANLRHPNVALFMGVCFMENCLLPVLLMEKLDDCLDNLLETAIATNGALLAVGGLGSTTIYIPLPT